MIVHIRFCNMCEKWKDGVCGECGEKTTETGGCMHPDPRSSRKVKKSG
jgi:hypothetical protein